MKIRNGFVSNSSSSSFVVAFKKIPKSVEEVQKLLFTDQALHSYYEHKYTTHEIAEQVFRDIQEHRPIKLRTVTKEVASGYYEGRPEFPMGVGSNDLPAWRKAWTAWEHDYKAFARAVAEEFWKENQGKFTYRFQYSDNDGEFWGMMEHSGIFERLPHLEISHH